MAISQKYLERVRRLSQGKDKPKTVSLQQIARLDAAIKQQRTGCEKGGWRASAKWLEENFPEDFPNPEPVNEPTAGEPQPLANAPESPQSAREALGAPLPVPLPSTFWQALLYGSPDALVSPRDANTALRLVAHELGKDSDGVQFSDNVRVNTLRKMFDQQFGAKVWHAMNRLW